jgi:ankyrin repeat protein
MRNLLWKYYLEDNVDRFRHLLENVNQNLQYPSKGYAGGGGQSGSLGAIAGSPGAQATPPRTVAKNRKVSGPGGNSGGIKGASTTVNRADLNSRDHAGLTILHRAASSTTSNATSFALALIEHPAIDLYIQDTENGWTALHRALYFGNITVARAIIARDRGGPNGAGGNVSTRAISSVIKVKDHEGNSPFDVYNATIARRSLQQITEAAGSDDGSQDDAESVNGRTGSNATSANDLAIGDELFVFGSNKNHSLGFGDGDDRQRPEKITLKRPDHLLFRFYREYLESIEDSSDLSQSDVLKPFPKSLDELPTLISNRPVIVQDVALSKLHSAILTTDPESNLYMCGFGPGGRLGTGDEVTRSTFLCIEDGVLAGKKVITVALGQNHTLAVSAEGEVFSWGISTYGQLGYSLPQPTMKDEEPICPTPRQIFGPLKRETIIGVAASAIHSVAHSSSSLFCWGKNEGQLGLMDSDSRSLAVQPIPRKVGASLFKAPIQMVSAINGATICLLANHTVCVFTNYGYNIVKFPLYTEFTNYHLQSAALTTRYDGATNHISSITAGGDTIAAVSSRGDLFTLNVRKSDPDIPSASTTNPSKIKSSLSPPQRIWSLRKGHWDGIKSVGVSENGSVIICTHAGAVWRRVNRPKVKDAFTGAGGLSRKDYKFQRVPGLTKVAAVRSNTFGVYAAIRRDCDVTKSQIMVDEQNLWQDVRPLLSIRDITASDSPPQGNTQANKIPASLKDLSNPLKRAVLTSPDIESDVSQYLSSQDLRSYDFELRSSVSEVGIPVHGFMLAARSSILRSALADFRLLDSASVADLFVIEEASSTSLPRIVFQGLDFITIVNLAIYLYTDQVVDVWNFTRQSPKMAFRYRQIRSELMKTASLLKISQLESAVRLMREPERQLDRDMGLAIQDTAFFEDGDCIVDLDGSEVGVHSALLCQRCPFFEGLFNGRAAGQWLAGRRQDDLNTVRIDLKHIDPETFQLVLRYLYADVGSELFDDVVSGDIDEFSELVMDVMAVANELMLDRLSQICQEVIGRFGKCYFFVFICATRS